MKVGLLMGGRSGEHDVSLVTGAAIRAALQALDHVVFEIVIERTGGARWSGAATGSGTVLAAIDALASWGADAAFIAMHGADGEDGRVQAALELAGVPYQGSGVSASAIALDKGRTKALYRASGLPVAADRTLRHGEAVDWPELAATLGLPLVLKTAASGSSVGVEIVDTPEALAERGVALLAQTTSLVVEAYLAGREFTVPVLEDRDGTPRALPVIEIRPVTARFFDYEAKYTPGATDELCPAPIDDALVARLQALGLAAHLALGCRHYSRTDLMLDAEGEPRLLETNTLPGLTPASLMPKATAAVGMSFPALVERLLALARRDA